MLIDSPLPSQELLSSGEFLPKHIALIMDGNRRWAEIHGYPPLYGHARGAEQLQEIVIASVEIGVKAITAYAFSTENWQRSAAEIAALFDLFGSTLRKQAEIMLANGVRFRWIGVSQGLPQELLNVLEYVTQITAEGEKMELVLAINYGARDEIRRAVVKIAEECVAGNLSPDDISENLIDSFLDISSLCPPDLLIRTSGEQRLSNFLLWHVAYSEFLFTNTLWPDFTREEYYSILQNYQQRQRRLGK